MWRRIEGDSAWTFIVIKGSCNKSAVLLSDYIRNSAGCQTSKSEWWVLHQRLVGIRLNSGSRGKKHVNRTSIAPQTRPGDFVFDDREKLESLNAAFRAVQSPSVAEAMTFGPTYHSSSRKMMLWPSCETWIWKHLVAVLSLRINFWKSDESLVSPKVTSQRSSMQLMPMREFRLKGTWRSSVTAPKMPTKKWTWQCIDVPLLDRYVRRQLINLQK